MTLAIIIARNSSIRLAAREAGLPASTVSRRLRAMEDELGVSLFERRASGVKLTSAGERFLAEATRVLSGVRIAAERARNAGSAAIGQLVVGTYFSASKGSFREALVEFQQQNEGLQVLLQEGRRGALLAALRRGEVDMALLLGPADEPGMDRLRLWKETAMVALADYHPLANGPLARWTDLASETFLMTLGGSGPEARQKVDALLPVGNRARFIEQDIGREALFNLVGAGFGVAVLAESASGASYPSVVFRPVGDDAGPTMLEAAAYWDPKRDNPALRRFLAVLRVRQEPALRSGDPG